MVTTHRRRFLSWHRQGLRPYAPPATLLSPHKAYYIPSQQDHGTPLNRAARNGHEATCRVLIEAGAKVDAKDFVSLHCMGMDAVYVWAMCDSNCAIYVFPGCVYRALGHLCMERLHRRLHHVRPK